MADNKADLVLISEAAREAGTLIMGYFQKDLDVRFKKPGDPVSEADLAADQLIRKALLDARPDYGWLSEETVDDHSRLEATRTFIVDPIDGTRAFIKGREEFCISIALSEAGHIIAGAIYDPCRDQLYSAMSGAGAHCNGNLMTVSQTSSLNQAAILGDPGKLTDLRDMGATATTINSVALRLARVASGEFDGLVSVRDKWDWDIAAGDLLMQEAGGQLTGQKGERFRYDEHTPRKPAPIAAGPALHPLLLNR